VSVLELDLQSLKIFTSWIYFFFTLEFYFCITLRGGFIFLQYNFPGLSFPSLVIDGV